MDLPGNSLSLYRPRCQVVGIVKVRDKSEELGTDGSDMFHVSVLYFRN